MISQIKEEATTLAESVIVQDEYDDVPHPSYGIQQTKGEHKLMQLLDINRHNGKP